MKLRPTILAHETGDPFTFAPIRTAAPAPRKGLAAFLAVALPTLLVLGGAGAAAHRLDAPARAYPRVLNVVLDDVGDPPPPWTPPPIPRPPEAPREAQDLPGEGHILGNGAIDPALLTLPVARHPALPDDDPDGVKALEPQAPAPGLNRNLPVAPGGNGFARGTGLEAGRGGTRRKDFDYRLVLLHEEPAESDLPATSPELLVPVKVLIRVGEDGKPMGAAVLSGPEPLHQDCLRAALTYRWEPLAKHGLEAPIHVVVTFHPMVRDRKGSKAPLRLPVPPDLF